MNHEWFEPQAKLIRIRNYTTRCNIIRFILILQRECFVAKMSRCATFFHRKFYIKRKRNLSSKISWQIITRRQIAIIIINSTFDFDFSVGEFFLFSFCAWQKLGLYAGILVRISAPSAFFFNFFLLCSILYNTNGFSLLVWKKIKLKRA